MCAGAQAAEEIRHPGSGLPVERMGQAGPGPASMGEFGEGGSNYVMPEGATNKPHGRVVAEVRGAWVLGAVPTCRPVVMPHVAGAVAASDLTCSDQIWHQAPGA